jgi:hypothetical protein
MLFATPPRAAAELVVPVHQKGSMLLARKPQPSRRWLSGPSGMFTAIHMARRRSMVVERSGVLRVPPNARASTDTQAEP